MTEKQKVFFLATFFDRRQNVANLKSADANWDYLPKRLL